MQIGLLSGKCVSKQGLFDRLHAGATAFARELLQQVLLQQSSKEFKASLFGGFGKVLLQDSTTLYLPQKLSGLFPGNYSHGEQNAVARIQSIIDIKAMKFIDLTLGSYTQNDQSASGSIMEIIKKGDLVIRDLGYFALAIFKRLIAAEAHFLSRLRYGVRIYSEQGHPIALKSLLKQNQIVDKWILIGVEHQVRVRLIMLPLSVRQTAEKIRKAKRDRDKRLNHSTEYYQWLAYNVFITTVNEEVWTAKDAARAYHVRWQIEIIFKSWKTGFHLQGLLHEGCGNEHRVKVSIYLMLLFICLFMQKVYMRYKEDIEKNPDKRVSLVKLATFVSQNILEIFMVSHGRLKELIAQYCCYEKRYDRTNMTDFVQNFKN